MHKNDEFSEIPRAIDPADPKYFGNILKASLTRRQALLGSASAFATFTLGGLGLSGCTLDDNGNTEAGLANPAPLGFAATPKSLADVVTVPAGYSANVLFAFGDPIAAGVAAYVGDGSETGASYAQRAGDHHDGMHYFGLGADNKYSLTESGRGLLVMNHENITQSYLHAAGPTSVAGARTVEDEVLKEINSHGVSVVEIKKNVSGKFAVVQDSTFNRRITPFTDMELNGPVRGSKFAVSKLSTNATKTRGTINNCANGYTPWGTYLTCEENWKFYFTRAASDASNPLRSSSDNAAFARYTINPGQVDSFNWASLPGDQYQRWNCSVTGTSANGADDFRNLPQTYGYVVEIDPFNPSSVPRKRTALGRFGHEGAWPAKIVAGKPLTFYMGDDVAGEYIYKFVSTAVWDPADANKGMTAGDKYMDNGTLYVARFDADGTGQWLELTQGKNGLNSDNALFPFNSQAAVCVNTRLAGDSVGATKMDRPEWAAVNPLNGEVYLTLTNNSSRGNSTFPLDAANPRRYSSGAAGGVPGTGGNINGHIIRWREASDNPAATSFTWDIFLFGSRAGYTNPAVNASELTADNDLSSPDGLWFAPNGQLWIQTDDSAYADTTNCMMLVAAPGKVGDGGAATLNGQATFKGKSLGTDLRRFLVGPKQCELTGITMTPDSKAMFVQIQHPGENGTIAAPTSNWPNISGDATVVGVAGARPRSATVIITKDDGGVIGV